MNNRKPFTLVDLALMILITTVLAALLLPVFLKVKTLQSSRCQSNMYRLGTAIHMYLSDWDYIYPTNRPYNTSTYPPSLLQIMPSVRLSDPNWAMYYDPPIRFQYGIGWVEALYPYIERVPEGSTPSVWSCPLAREVKGPGQSNYAGVTYAFNRNLIEYPKTRVKSISKVMMIRELDRKYDSVLRPSNLSLTSAGLPSDPFLGPEDKNVNKGLNYRMHGEGSHILFADGHVKNYPSAYFGQMQANGQWDSQTQQWWNLVNLPTTDPKRKTIAISP